MPRASCGGLTGTLRSPARSAILRSWTEPRTSTACAGGSTTRARRCRGCANGCTPRPQTSHRPTGSRTRTSTSTFTFGASRSRSRRRLPNSTTLQRSSCSTRSSPHDRCGSSSSSRASAAAGQRSSRRCTTLSPTARRVCDSPWSSSTSSVTPRNPRRRRVEPRRRTPGAPRSPRLRKPSPMS